MVRRLFRLVPGLLLLVPLTLGAQETADTLPTVRAVLFYSPTCPHCQEFISQDLPGILERFGSQLQIAGVNTASDGGAQLYRAMVRELNVPEDRAGVPTMVVGSTVLVGGWEIPELFPDIVAEALAEDGIDWPPVSLIREAVAADEAQDTASGEAQTAAAAENRAEAPPEVAADATPPDSAVAPDPAPADTPGPADTTEESVPPPADPTTEDSPTGAPAMETPAGGQSDAMGEAEPSPPGAAAGEAVEGAAGPAAGSDDPDPTLGDAPEGAPAEQTPPPAGQGTPDRETGDGGELAGVLETTEVLVHDLSMTQRLMLDPAGNGTAVAVLLLMLITVALVGADAVGRIRIPAPPVWAVPVLAVVGMAVASYLAFVEVTGTEAVCGPVGDCNTVQQSTYARFLGIHVGVLGVLGYGAMLAVWALGRLMPSLRATARTAVWVLAAVATGFSIYLTFLEPFVIGASCAWCLGSAATTTLIFVAATGERSVGVSPTPGPSVSS